MLTNLLLTLILALQFFYTASFVTNSTTRIVRPYCTVNYTEEYHVLRTKAIDNCKSKLNFTNWEKISLVDFTNEFIENGCLQKCIHETLNQTTADGRWDVNKFIEYESKSNATEEYLQVLLSSVTVCVSAAEEGLKKVGGFKKQLCLYHNAANSCRLYEEFRSQLNRQFACKSP